MTSPILDFLLILKGLSSEMEGGIEVEPSMDRSPFKHFTAQLIFLLVTYGQVYNLHF